MSERWPAWATQPVEVTEPDPRWSQAAAALAEDLDRRLSPWLVGRVEHVGSTSVAGLAAKPVLDLMAPVRRLADTADADELLTAASWELVPVELDGRPWRRFYVLPDGDQRRAHLHLVERTHERFAETLAFRDQLRQRPDLAATYAKLKRTAAHDHLDDREAYTAAKSAFIRSVVDDAVAAADERATRPPST